jgi:hypothetical protein
MKIVLSAIQEGRLLEWVGLRMSEQVESGCEPSGYELVVSVCGPYGASATARIGKLAIELGEVEVQLLQTAA